MWLALGLVVWVGLGLLWTGFSTFLFLPHSFPPSLPFVIISLHAHPAIWGRMVSWEVVSTHETLGLFPAPLVWHTRFVYQVAETLICLYLYGDLNSASRAASVAQLVEHNV